MEGRGRLVDPLLRGRVRIVVRGYGLAVYDAPRFSDGFGVFGRRIVPVPTLHASRWKTATNATTTTTIVTTNTTTATITAATVAATAARVFIAEIISLIARWKVATVLMTTALAARLRETPGLLGASLSQGVWSVKQLGLPLPVVTKPVHGLDPVVPRVHDGHGTHGYGWDGHAESATAKSSSSQNPVLSEIYGTVY